MCSTLNQLWYKCNSCSFNQDNTALYLLQFNIIRKWEIGLKQKYKQQHRQIATRQSCATVKTPYRIKRFLKDGGLSFEPTAYSGRSVLFQFASMPFPVAKNENFKKYQLLAPISPIQSHPLNSEFTR